MLGVSPSSSLDSLATEEAGEGGRGATRPMASRSIPTALVATRAQSHCRERWRAGPAASCARFLTPYARALLPPVRARLVRAEQTRRGEPRPPRSPLLVGGSTRPGFYPHHLRTAAASAAAWPPASRFRLVCPHCNVSATGWPARNALLLRCWE